MFTNIARREEEDHVSEYARLVRAIIRPYFQGGAEYDDLYQEGMIGLLKAVRTYDSSRGARFETYAAACIRNRIFDIVRRQNKEQTFSSGSVHQPSALLSSAGGERCFDPETEVLAIESAQEIKAVLSDLLSSFEASVLEPYLQGYTATEIARVLSRPAKSVDNAIRRIRRKIAQHLSHGDNRSHPVRINPNPQKGTKER